MVKFADSNFDISMSEPPPKSQMLRVPTALIPVVRELSRLYREGHTIALLQSLQDVIFEIDSKIDSNFISTNTNTKHLEEKLDRLETQLKSDSLGGNIEPMGSTIQSSNNKNIQATTIY